MRDRGRAVAAFALLVLVAGAAALGATVASAKQPTVPVPTQATLTLLVTTLDSNHRAGLVYDPQLYSKLRKQLQRAQAELAAADAQSDVQQFADTLQQQLDQIANSNGKKTGDPPSINTSSAQTLIALANGAAPPTSFPVAPSATAPAVVASVVATTPVTVTVPPASPITTVSVTPPPPAAPLPPPPVNGTAVSSMVVTASSSSGPVTTLTTPAPLSSTFTPPANINPYSAVFYTFDPVTNAPTPLLPTTVTANPDGTFTATASTPHFSTFVVNAGRPTVTSVTPNYGPIAGGANLGGPTSVTIGGFSLASPTRVLFNGVDGTSVSYAGNTLTAIPPAAPAAGSFAVQVVAGGQFSDPVNAPQYTYYAPLSVSAQVSPLTVYTGNGVTLNGFSSGGYGPVTFAWTYSDGGGASGPTQIRPYNTAGDFTATVAATDSIGNQASTTVTIHVQLPQLAGTVTDAASHAALAGITVEVDSFTQVPGDGIADIAAVATATTSASGTWSAAVPNGAYKVRFLQTASYAGQWLGGGARAGKAPTTTVNGAPVSGLDAGLAHGFQLSGAVFKPDGITAVPGTFVSAFVSGSNCCTPLAPAAVTDSGGAYSITVPDGSSAILDASPPAGLLDAFYNGAAGGTPNPASATAFTAAATANFRLAAGDVIQGTVSFGSPAKPVRFVNVNALVQGGGGYGGQSDASGVYQLTVPSGTPATYVLKFNPLNDGSTGSPAAVYSGGGTDPFTAAAVGHSPGAATVYDLTLPAGFRVAGAVSPATAGLGAQIWDVSQASQGGFPPLINGSTDGSGGYGFLVPNGKYLVHLNPNNQNGLLQVWYQNASSSSGATQILVAGAEVALSQVLLATGYQINGTVSPLLPGYNVFVAANLPPPAGGCCPQFVAGTRVDSSTGKFQLLVPNGSYVLQVNPEVASHYMQQWWDGANGVSDPHNATVIAIANANYTGSVAVTLQHGNLISGRVTDTSTPTPLGIANVNFGVNLNGPGGACCGKGSFVTGGRTDGGGNFSVLVAAGSYTLMFNPPAPYLRGQAVADVTAGDLATPLAVQLGTGFTLQGNVFDPSGSPLANVNVNIQSVACCQGWGTQIDRSGHYAIGLPAGSYQVAANPPPGSPLLTQWYQGAGSQDQATTVALSASSSPFTADFHLVAGVLLSGHVVNAATPAVGLGGVQVGVFVNRGARVPATCCSKGDPGLGANVANTSSGPDGYWSVNVPANGGYVVQFTNPPPGNLPGEILVAPITGPVDTGSTVLSAGVVLSGTVTGPGGGGVGQVSVNAWQPFQGGCCVPRNALTDGSGGYQLTVEKNANWIIQFQPGGFGGPSNLAPVFYSSGSSAGTGAPTKATVVNSGSPPPAISVQLAVGQVISGQVTGSDGSILAGTPVDLQDPAAIDTCCYPSLAFVPTDASGKFSFEAPPGTWLVQAGGNPGSSYLPAFYSSSGTTLDVHQATPVGASTSLSLVLPKGVVLTGTVRAGGAAEAGVNVFPATLRADQSCCQAFLPGTVTGSTGGFSLLIPGGVPIMLNVNPPPGFLQQQVLVPAGSTLQDVTLVAGSVISGVVTDSRITGGAPNGVSGVGVSAYDPGNGCCFGPTTQTDGFGNYSLTVPNGNWILSFTPSSGSLAPAFWNGTAAGATSPVDATPIVISGSSVGARNVSLVAGTTIFGTVSGGGSGVRNVWVRAIDSRTLSACCYPAVAQARTDASGSGAYSMVVPAGSWLVQAAPDPNLPFVEQWYGGTFDGGSATAVAGGAIARDIVLAPGYLFSGTVTVAGSTLVPAPGIARVNVFGRLGSGCCGVGVNGTQTDANGNYSLYLPAGAGHLDFSPPPGYFGTGSDVTVSATGTGNVLNVALTAGAVVSGHVVAKASGLAVGRVSVTAFEVGGSGRSFSALSDASGAFALTLPVGSWDVQLVPPASGGLVAQWYTGAADGSGAATQAGALPVVVSAGSGGVPADVTLVQSALG